MSITLKTGFYEDDNVNYLLWKPCYLSVCILTEPHSDSGKLSSSDHRVCSTTTSASEVKYYLTTLGRMKLCRCTGTTNTTAVPQYIGIVTVWQPMPKESAVGVTLSSSWRVQHLLVRHVNGLTSPLSVLAKDYVLIY